MQTSEQKPSFWLDRKVFSMPRLSVEALLYSLILILALFSRFYILGARVMSHDENSHVYYSWRFFKGEGFTHDPLMHGPLQFHLVALSYFMFGDTDFTARIPAALFSVATVMFMWFYRRYLGRVGALVAALLMLISPYMSFYGRYVRNEAFVGLFGVALIWAILRYLELGKPMYMYIITVTTVLHFTTKETAFIYTAIAMLFLGFHFLFQVVNIEWDKPHQRNLFLIALIVMLIFLGAAGAYSLLTGQKTATDAALTAIPAVPGGELSPPPATGPAAFPLMMLILSVLALVAALYFLFTGFGLEGLRKNRAFSIVIVLLTLVLPQLSAFPVFLMGWKIPTNVSEVMSMTLQDYLHIAMFLIPLTLLSVAIGVLWNWREWLINAGLWYGLFTLFFTTVFTNGAGFFTGLVGALGYWLAQQDVQRGSQPLYYYALVQMPVYEFLPALGTLMAIGIAARAWLKRRTVSSTAATALGEPETILIEAEAQPDIDSAAPPSEPDEELDEILEEPEEYKLVEPPPVIALLSFWTVLSLIAYSVAGEKMPWLTVHITLGAILCTGWALNRLIGAIDWGLLRKPQLVAGLALAPIWLLSLLAALGSLLGDQPPFRGKELVHLQATSQFLVSLLFTLVGAGVLYYLLKGWPFLQFGRYLSLSFIVLLALLTAHTTIQANYYNYDYANELLVYAHSAPGVKIAMDQIEEISRRTTDGLGIQVAYDNETSYPYWWYLRNYPNARYYGADPSRALREAPIILVGDANFGKIEPVVANLYDRFDYIRLWWPNQDYFGLTWQRVWGALRDPVMRSALFQIWLNRDYTKYGKALGRDMSLSNWSPAAHMRLYIRKDITSKLWNYGSAPAAVEQLLDPFEGKQIQLAAAATVGSMGVAPGQFQRPRDLAFAPDGSLYVADTENNRVQHLQPDGSVISVWGSFGDVATGQAPGGAFNQPWGIAVGLDGSVFVADTWNHRIQRFDHDGNFIQMWGSFGQAETPEAFWGPRALAVDAEGRLYVTDTGNKRIVIFTPDGQFVTQFGSAGMGAGQLDEPTGVAVDPSGLVYVADTWNQRIQVFQENEQGEFVSLRSWDLQAWYGQSLDNKPYLAVDASGNVFASDPEGYRVMEFSPNGEALRAWGDVGAGMAQFNLPGGLAIAHDGSIWVADAGNNRLMRFVLP